MATQWKQTTKSCKCNAVWKLLLDRQYHLHTTSLLNTEECKTAKPVLCFPTETNKTEELIGFQTVTVAVVHVWVWV